MLKSDWWRSKEQDILVAKINMKVERKGVRNAQKNTLKGRREGEYGLK